MPRRRVWILALLVMLAVLAVALWWQPWRTPPAAVEGEHLASFPAVDTTGLNATQVAIVDRLREQVAAHHPGTFYAEGTEEPWCADFVSWIMNAAGHPLDNPGSGSWRIPGVATLQEYYQANGRFRPVDAGYLPQVGDVVLYGDPSPFHQHTNIVIAADPQAWTITTVGGAEPGGIGIHRFGLADDPGILGFGVL